MNIGRNTAHLIVNCRHYRNRFFGCINVGELVSNFENRIPYYRERLCVKPGITGWAQLCYPYGSSEHDTAEKLQYDLYYVKNHSLLFDIVILLQTAEVVLWGQGAR